MIVIIARLQDVHARCVAIELQRRGHAVAIVDTGSVPRGALIRHHVGKCRVISLQDAGSIDLENVQAVWYRRPYPPELPTNMEDEDRHFARAEWEHAFQGLLLGLKARLVNPLSAELAAIKPRQLELAREIGLRIPDTLITNDPSEAEAFLRLHAKQVVHKAMTAPRNFLVDTRPWVEEDRRALGGLVLAPTIFQEQISGPSDVRVTVVGEQMFAASIATSQSRAGIDSRLDLDVPHEPHHLPSLVRQRLGRLVKELGLLYATVDLKVTDEGDYVFLEVNPQGQFLYIEILTGLPITDAVASLLADP